MRISDWSSDVCSSDLDLDIVVDHGIDPDAGEAGVAARGAVIRADADEAVDAAFGLGVAIRILALEQQRRGFDPRSEEHTSELQSLMRISYAVFCLKKKKTKKII